MIVLGLDPSSTRTGYAVMSAADDLIDAGYFRPRRSRDKALYRIDAMVADLAEVLVHYRPDLVVIEIPSGRPGAGIKAGAKAQLAIYGMAVGEMRRFAIEYMCTRGDDLPPLVSRFAAQRVLCVDERRWTGGRPKALRQQQVAMLFPGYAAVISKDSGCDAGDAVGVVLWFWAAYALACKADDAMQLAD